MPIFAFPPPPTLARSAAIRELTVSTCCGLFLPIWMERDRDFLFPPFAQLRALFVPSAIPTHLGTLQSFEILLLTKQLLLGLSFYEQHCLRLLSRSPPFFFVFSLTRTFLWQTDRTLLFPKNLIEKRVILKSHLCPAGPVFWFPWFLLSDSSF